MHLLYIHSSWFISVIIQDCHNRHLFIEIYENLINIKGIFIQTFQYEMTLNKQESLEGEYANWI